MFERAVYGMSIYRDPDNLAPREIFYASRQAANSIYIGAEVDVESLTFDLALSDYDREMCKYLRVAL